MIQLSWENPKPDSPNHKTQSHVQIPLAISGKHELAGDFLAGIVRHNFFGKYHLDHDPEKGLYRQNVEPATGRR